MQVRNTKGDEKICFDEWAWENSERALSGISWPMCSEQSITQSLGCFHIPQEPLPCAFPLALSFLLALSRSRGVCAGGRAGEGDKPKLIWAESTPSTLGTRTEGGSAIGSGVTPPSAQPGPFGEE